MTRRFPAPWRVEKRGEAFIVYDAKGVPITYSYFENAEERRQLMNRLTEDEARRIALNVAKLPELLKKEGD